MDQFIADHLFQILSKVYLQTLKKPVQFSAYPFSNIKKSILTNLKKNLARFFHYHLFQILKRSIIKNLEKIPGQIFGLPPISNINESILKNLKNHLAQFFADHNFGLIKKVYLKIFKKIWHFFLHLTFFKY